MIEAISTWTTEINGWHLIMIFLVLVGMALTGYGYGIARGSDLIDAHLRDLGIRASETECKITIHEPAEDKIAAEITWDEDDVVLTTYELDEQEWESEKA